MRMILLGAPGSGKGTQGQKLAEALGVPCISTGDALRAAVRKGSELGRKAKAMMDAGALVADTLVLGIVEDRLRQADARNGFILDGFPRNIRQAVALDELLQRQDLPAVDVVVNLDVNEGKILRRLLQRAEEQGRADDREDVIRSRIQVYTAETLPLIDYYTAQSKLLRLSGSGAVEEVFQGIVAAITELA